jgi:hypothetical protein
VRADRLKLIVASNATSTILTGNAARAGWVRYVKYTIFHINCLRGTHRVWLRPRIITKFPYSLPLVMLDEDSPAVKVAVERAMVDDAPEVSIGRNPGGLHVAERNVVDTKGM